MSLSFNFGNAQWSYSGFNYFRKKLASQLGIELCEMNGYKNHSDGIGISWDSVDTPLKGFFIHSDCEGYFTYLECVCYAPIIEDLVNDWPDEDRDKAIALELVAGMREAIERNTKLKFC